MSWQRVTAERGTGEWLVRETDDAVWALVCDGVGAPHGAPEVAGAGTWRLLAWHTSEAEDDYPIIGLDVPAGSRLRTVNVLTTVDAEHHAWVKHHLETSLRHVQHSLDSDGGFEDRTDLLATLRCAEAMLIDELVEAWPDGHWRRVVVAHRSPIDELEVLAIPDTVDELLSRAGAPPAAPRPRPRPRPASLVQEIDAASAEAYHAVGPLAPVLRDDWHDDDDNAFSEWAAQQAERAGVASPASRLLMGAVAWMTAAVLAVMLWRVVVSTGNPEPVRLIVGVTVALIGLAVLENRRMNGRWRVAAASTMAALLVGCVVAPASVWPQAASLRVGLAPPPSSAPKVHASSPPTVYDRTSAARGRATFDDLIVGHRIRIEHDQLPVFETPAESYTGMLLKGETFKVRRLSPSGKYAYGFAYGDLNKFAWALTTAVKN